MSHDLISPRVKDLSIFFTNSVSHILDILYNVLMISISPLDFHDTVAQIKFVLILTIHI